MELDLGRSKGRQSQRSPAIIRLDMNDALRKHYLLLAGRGLQSMKIADSVAKKGVRSPASGRHLSTWVACRSPSSLVKMEADVWRSHAMCGARFDNRWPPSIVE